MLRFILPFLLVFHPALFCQDSNYARHIVATLASPDFKGRGYVDNGNTLAADFIKQQFKSIGLLSVDQNYFQSFNLPVNIFPARADVIIDGKRLVPGSDFIIDPSSPAINGTYDVFLTKKSDMLSEKAKADIVESSAGKILIIDERDFTPGNPDDAKKAGNVIQYLKYAQGLKHVCTIIITSEKLTWNISTMQTDRPCIIIRSVIEIKPDSRVTLRIDAKLIQYKTNNVIGYIKGTSVPDSFLVCIAHYDHLGMMGKETLFPGANDNASGVAMLLSLAKYFQANPLKYSFLFIALSAEEPGVIGASYFVDHPVVDLKKMKFLVNFDLAGTGEEGIKVVNGSVYRDKFDLLQKLNEQHQYLKSVQIRGAACNSDHCMFYERKVPSFYIYTLGGIQAYHDIYDRPETLPLNEFSDYCQLMIDFFSKM